MCVLKAKGLEECIRQFCDHPAFECRKCGARANSPRNLCRAQLGDWQPDVADGRGTHNRENSDKLHSGQVVRNTYAGREAVIMQVPKDIVKEKDRPATGTPPDPPAEPDHTAGDGKGQEGDPEIAITQVPMDGVCGGY